MIPAYTLSFGKVHPGIRLQCGRIGVGECGRGRNRVRVEVLPPLGSTIAGDMLLAVPPPADAPDVAVCVLIRDHSGYRGTWCIREYAERFCSARVAPSVLEGQPCPECGGLPYHLLVPSSPLSPESLGLVIAEGHCGQGVSGRLGGGPEYLLFLRPEVRFSIASQGRVAGPSPRINVRVGPGGALVAISVYEEIAAQPVEALWGQQSR